MDTLTLGIYTRSDRELLELAAKAAGFFYHGARIGSDYLNCYVSTTNDSEDWFVWSPLTDDGDALRLAVKLRLVIQHAPKYVVVLDGERVIAEHQDTRENGGDENAATRRAIVRAAAAIGEKQ